MVTRFIFSRPSAYSCFIVPFFKDWCIPQVILALGVIPIFKISKIVEDGRTVCLIVPFSEAQQSEESPVQYQKVKQCIPGNPLK